MGSYAASGGYWISADADKIFASPTTLTGSIGVFGMFATIDKALSQYGCTPTASAPPTSWGSG